MKFLAVFFSSLVLALVLTPVVEKIAYRLRVIDIPDGRKRHRVPIPLLGGLAIYLSFFITTGVFMFCTDRWAGAEQRIFLGLFVASTFVFLGGVVDDTRGLDAPQKFSVQIAAALILVLFGYPQDVLLKLIPGLPHTQTLEYLGIAFFVFWMVMLTNAMNLIDGLDGLAAGVAFVAAYFLLLTAIALKRPLMVPLSLALCGATLGFLRYNFHPARIFMGDAGSMLLGFLLGATSFQGLAKRVTLFTLLIPVILLAIPIFDTILAFVRRLLSGKNPFVADRDHFHHKMIRLGLTQAQAVTIVYLVCAVFGILSLSLVRFGSQVIIVVFLVVSLLVFAGLYVLGYFRPGERPEFEFVEKRTLPRTFKELLVDYECRGKKSRALSLDISLGGIFLRTQTPLEVGAHLTLRFIDPATQKPVERHGTVVWNTTQSPKPHEVSGMGIMFTAPVEARSEAST